MITKRMWGVLLATLVISGCGDGNLLGPDSEQAPSIPQQRVAEHVDLVVAGEGIQIQPGTLIFTLPVSYDADIVEARFVWTGRGTDSVGDSTIVLNNVERTGTLVARLFVPESPQWIFVYQLDARGIAQPGSNRFTVSGFALPGGRADGIAFEAVINSPSSPWTRIRLVTPNEFVQGDTPGYERGQVESFAITPSSEPRTARFVTIVADGLSSRPDRTWWTTGSGAVPAVVAGAGTLMANRYVSGMGARLDILQMASAPIPAGASYLAYQLESPLSGDSLIHLMGALCIADAPPCPGHIDGVVWQDLNGDGVEDLGEPGYSGVRLTLADGAGGFLEETYTSPTGDFSFTGRCAGSYVVTVDTSTLPAGAEPTTCGGAGACSPADVSLPANDSSVGLPFGWAEPIPAYCFHDASWWRLQVGTALGSTQGGEVGTTLLTQYLGIAAAATHVDFDHGDGVISLEEAQVFLKDDSDIHARALASYLATLLNFGWTGGDYSLPVDTSGDSTPDQTFGDAIQQLDAYFAAPLPPGRTPTRFRTSLAVSEAINAMHDGRCSGRLQ